MSVDGFMRAGNRFPAYFKEEGPGRINTPHVRYATVPWETIDPVGDSISNEAAAFILREWNRKRKNDKQIWYGDLPFSFSYIL